MRVLKKYWHEHMLQLVANHTDAPDKFIEWTSFSVLGGVMKRKFYIRDGLYTIFPNQYIVLVAPPGVGKGTSINFLWSLVRKTAPNFIANMISDRVTAPKILERIAAGWAGPPATVGQQIVLGARDHSCTIFSTEMSILLGASDQMLDFLCEGWDRNEYEYDTKNCGSAFIRDMCTSLIAGTVPDFIQQIDRNKNMPVKGGFSSRCLFIFENKPARFLLHPPPLESNPNSVKQLDALKNDLLHIASLPGGEFFYDAASRITFDNFLTSVRTNTDNDSEAVANFKARIRAHVLKLAMVLALSRHDTQLIENCDMALAIAYVSQSLKNLELVFRGTGDSDIASATSRVQNYLEDVGIASRKELLSRLHRHMNVETLDRIIYVLTEIGYLCPKLVGTITYYSLSSNGTNPQNKKGGP